MPDHWKETTLDSLTSLTIGGVWGADPGEDEVDVPIYRQTEFDDSGRLHQPAGAIRSITHRQLEGRTLVENDVLIQKSAGTPTLPGRVVLVPQLSEASSFSNFLTLIRADRHVVEPVFLFLVLQHRHATKVAFEFQRGTNIRNLDLKSYLATTVLVPPLEEQRRIVDLVGSIDAYIDSLETQIETTRTARSALLSELLSNPGDDWQEVRIGDVAEVLGGKRLPKGTPWSATPTGRRYIRSVDINEGKIDTSALVWVPEDAIPVIEKYRVTTGDVLITIAGKIGQTAVVPPALDGENLTENAALIRIFGEGLAPEFLHFWLSSATGQASIEEVTVGTSQRKLALVRIKDLHVQVPPNLDQSRILGLVGSIDEQISSLESQVESVRTLRLGVLSELLSGERLLDESYEMAVGL